MFDSEDVHQGTAEEEDDSQEQESQNYRTQSSVVMFLFFHEVRV